MTGERGRPGRPLKSRLLLALLACALAVWAGPLRAAPKPAADLPVLAAAERLAAALPPEKRALAGLAVARGLLDTGRTAEALLRLETASAEIALNRRSLDLNGWLGAQGDIALLLHAAGRTTAGVDLLAALEREFPNITDTRILVPTIARLAEVHERCGRRGDTRRLAEGALRALSFTGDPNAIATGLGLKAKLLARLRMDTDAVEVLKVADAVIPTLTEDLRYALNTESSELVEASYLRCNHWLIAADVWFDLKRPDRVAAILATVEAELKLVGFHDYSDEVYAALARLDARQDNAATAEARLAKVGDYRLRADTVVYLLERVADRDAPDRLATLRAAYDRLKGALAVSPDDRDRALALLARAEAKAGDLDAVLDRLAGIAAPEAAAALLATLPALDPAFARPDPLLAARLGRLPAFSQKERK